MYIYIYRALIGVPDGLVGGPRAYQDQFLGFQYEGLHARGDFSCKNKIDH